MSQPHAPEVAAALLLDATLGEPPELVHPTVLMGRTVAALQRGALRLEGRVPRRLAGIALALSVPAVTFMATRRFLDAVPAGGPRWTVGVALISTTISMRGLGEAARSVELALRGGGLEEARGLLGRFVGRDTAGLSEAEVCRAAVESVAENTSDGIVAPMLYGLLLGAPGALAYRAVNTLDSMVGHPQEPYREIGRASARLDDLANLVPSRITALLVAVVSGRFLHTISITRRYGSLTASPNAGVAEAAFAGALGVRLGGVNTYGGVLRPGATLGEGGPPTSDDLTRAVILMRRCCLLLGLLALLPERAWRG